MNIIKYTKFTLLKSGTFKKILGFKSYFFSLLADAKELIARMNDISINIIAKLLLPIQVNS